MRSSWVLLLALLFLNIELLFLAAGYMTNSSSVLVAASSIGFIVGVFSCELTKPLCIRDLQTNSNVQIGQGVQACGLMD